MLAVGVAIIYESILHLTLQDLWATLGIKPSFWFGVFKGSFAGLVLLSIVHIVFRLDALKGQNK